MALFIETHFSMKCNGKPCGENRCGSRPALTWVRGWRSKKAPDLFGLAASFLVDIPTHWEPRTNKHPTGVFVAPPAAWPCCSSPVPPTTKNPQTFVWGFFVWWWYRTRTISPRIQAKKRTKAGYHHEGGTLPFESLCGKSCGKPAYSSGMPALAQASRVAASQTLACTSPMWALPSSSMHRRLWPMPPPME